MLSNLFSCSVKSSIFTRFMIFCVVANTVVLSLESYPIDPAVTQVVDYCNAIFSLIFLVELILTVVGLGVNEFCRCLCCDTLVLFFMLRLCAEIQ